MKLSLKGENKNKNTNEKKEEHKKYTKSNTYNNQTSNSNNSFINYNNLINNDNIYTNKIHIQKSRTCLVNEVKSQNIKLGFNNLKGNHLETVLETVSEVSNSKIDSSEKSKKNEENEDTGKNKTKETGKNKEELGNNKCGRKNSEIDEKINDNDCNDNAKKLLFLS